MDVIVVKHSISSQACSVMLAAAEKKARELGLPISVAVVDESGILKAFTRMDGAALISIDAALKKAITAVGFGLPTGAAWYDFIKDDPVLLHGVQSFTNFTLLGGGMALEIGGQRVGAVGVSGGHYSHDEECARAAVEALYSACDPTNPST